MYHTKKRLYVEADGSEAGGNCKIRGGWQSTFGRRHCGIA
jgi:hypothetical protein